MSDEASINPAGGSTSFDFAALAKRYWKWFLGGVAGVVVLVWFLKRRGGTVAALPTTPETPSGNPAPAVDLSGVTGAITNLAGFVAESNAQSSATLAGYQTTLADLIRAQTSGVRSAVDTTNAAVAAAAASTNTAVTTAVTSLNKTVTDTLNKVAGTVKLDTPKVDSGAAVKDGNKPLSTSYDPGFGPVLGFGASVSDPALAAVLKDRAENPIYRDSEIKRTEAVIANRTSAALPITDQIAYWEKLTGRKYAAVTPVTPVKVSGGTATPI